MSVKHPSVDCSYWAGEAGGAVIVFYDEGTTVDELAADLGAADSVDLPGADVARSSRDGTVVFRVTGRMVSTAFKGDRHTAIALAKAVLGAA